MVGSSTGSILVAAALATAGWVYAARRQRTLAKRQLSFSTIQTNSLDPILSESSRRVSEEIRKCGLPNCFDKAIKKARKKAKKKNAQQQALGDKNKIRKNKKEWRKIVELRSDLRTVLNSYEGMAASIRRGDLEEYMLKDVERGSFVKTFEAAEIIIDKTRQSRANKRIYEHMEWLYDRWTTGSDDPVRNVIETIRGRPFHDRSSYIWFVLIFAFLFISLFFHVLF